MKIEELAGAPAWLREATTDNADVSLADGIVQWRGGTWRGGTWLGGTWHGGEDRLLYMASFLGIVFTEDGTATAYRTTKADGHGRHTLGFVQPEGLYHEEDLPPAGSGTCVKGIHVTSAARAWTYFGVDLTCQLWRVRFRREDLLDCDGDKARIAGGVFERIDNPFLRDATKVSGEGESAGGAR
jgi:hypothetical protein